MNTIYDAIAKRVKGKAFASAFAKIPREYFMWDQEQIEKMAKPTSTDKVLKWMLWKNFGKSELIEPKDIYLNVCSYTHWHFGVLKNKYKLLYLMTPGGGV